MTFGNLFSPTAPPSAVLITILLATIGFSIVWRTAIELIERALFGRPYDPWQQVAHEAVRSGFFTAGVVGAIVGASRMFS